MRFNIPTAEQNMHPLEECDDLGISLYIAARTFVKACF